MADHLVVGGQLGNYLIDSVIGRGGMSVVYGAKHARLGMPVALKVLAPELSSNDTFRERFLREAQIAAGIDHPNVIPIHDMGLHEDSLYIVMRYVAGGAVAVVVLASGSSTPAGKLSSSVLGRVPTNALDPRARGHTLVYTASLVNSVAQGAPARGVFLCHVGDVSAAVAETRRQASVGGVA